MEIAAQIAAHQQETGQPIGIKDLLIGSIALIHGTKILTNNKKDYERIDGLRLCE
jgi:predicted nucleic acid-binding protein